MHPATAHDCIKAFRPLNKREARAVLGNPGLGWAPGTVDEARALIAAENARMGGGIVPHPDRVIEARRQPVAQHYISDPDDYQDAGPYDSMMVVALVVLGALATLLLFAGWTASGPGCPGMDPSWIGWCK